VTSISAKDISFLLSENYVLTLSPYPTLLQRVHNRLRIC
jgi:hypothetical protein